MKPWAFVSLLSKSEIKQLFGQILVRRAVFLKKGRNSVHMLESEAGKKYILKLFDTSSKCLTETRILQSTAIQTLGICPEYVLSIPPRMLLMKYLNDHISLGGRKNPNFILDGPFLHSPASSVDNIVTLLENIQRLSSILNNFQFLGEKAIYKHDDLVFRALEFHPSLEFLLRKIGDLLNELHSTLRYQKNDSIVHGDFRPHHIYVDQRIKNPKLIDWEYSARGNVNFDLATLLLTIQLSKMDAHEDLVENLLSSISKSISINLKLIKYYSICLALSWMTQSHLSQKGLQFLRLVEKKKSFFEEL